MLSGNIGPFMGFLVMGVGLSWLYNRQPQVVVLNVVSNPVNQTVAAGQSATFTATADGNPDPPVQWQMSTDGGVTFIKMPGATSKQLLLTDVTLRENGNRYRAVFTGGVDSATTTAAILTVQ
jgi:hypothetical protein